MRAAIGQNTVFGAVNKKINGLQLKILLDDIIIVQEKCSFLHKGKDV